MICRLRLLALAAALFLTGCGGNLANQGSPYDRGCAFTRDCGPEG
jgi:hypothetical protein